MLVLWGRRAMINSSMKDDRQMFRSMFLRKLLMLGLALCGKSNLQPSD
jgi:hypothetical protein